MLILGMFCFITWFIIQENGGSYFEYLGSMTPFAYFVAFKNTYQN